MKKLLQNTLIFLYISLIFISFDLKAQDFSSQLSQCNQALEKGEYATSIAVANEILKRDQHHREALICKGRALGAEGKYQEGLKALELAANNSEPGLDQIIAHILIGNLHKKNQQFNEAIASYEKSLSISKAAKNDKFERVNHHYIGDVQSLKQDLNAALTSYQAGSKLAMNDNERAESFDRIAATYTALKQNDLALEYQLKSTIMQQKAGTLDDYANASYALGQAYQNTKDYEAAERTYAKLLQFSKDNGGAYYEAKANFGLAEVKAAKGEKEGAISTYKEALKVAKNIGANELAQEIDVALKKLN